MKQIFSIILTLLFSLCASAQVYEIETVTDSTFAIKKTEWGTDSLENVTYLTGALDSASLESALFGFIRQERTGQARAVKAEKQRSRNATSLGGLLSSFSDSTYFSWTQAVHSGLFTATASLPNYRIRVGSSFYWATCYIAGNGILRMELTDSAGSFISPRDNAAMYLYSTESFRLLPLDVIGEQVDMYLDRADSNRKVWEGEKADGTVVRIIQYLNR